MEIGSVLAEPTDFFPSDLICMRIYNVEADMDTTVADLDDAEKEWDDPGEMNDITVTSGSKISAVILGTSGFMGIGDRGVSLPMSAISVLTKAVGDDRFLVVKTSKEMLEKAPAFERELN